MQVIRVPLSEDVPINIDDEQTFGYEIKVSEDEPNVDGYYEVERAQRFNLPSMIMQYTLERAGYRFVRTKKGNADIELWKKVVEEPKQVSPEAADLVVRLQDVAVTTSVGSPFDMANPPEIMQLASRRLDAGQTVASKTIRITGTPRQIGLIYAFAAALSEDIE